MKTLTIIFILSLSACSDPVKKRNTAYHEDSLILNALKNKDWSEDTNKSDEDRDYIDSANFRISRKRYDSGNIFKEVYSDKLSKLDHHKAYYENGQLKEEGMLTSNNQIYVGIWKYYSNSGKLDSMVNYDKKYRITYFKAIKIAEKHGFKMPEMEIDLKHEIKNTFWEITTWEYFETHSNSVNSILIDTKNGKVIKPKYKFTNWY